MAQQVYRVLLRIRETCLVKHNHLILSVCLSKGVVIFFDDA